MLIPLVHSALGSIPANESGKPNDKPTDEGTEDPNKRRSQPNRYEDMSNIAFVQTQPTANPEEKEKLNEGKTERSPGDGNQLKVDLSRASIGSHPFGQSLGFDGEGPLWDISRPCRIVSDSSTATE